MAEKRLYKAADAAAVVGIDQSATGTAAVALDAAGKLLGVLFWADTKSGAKALADRGALPPREVKAGDEAGRAARLEELRVQLGGFLSEWTPAHAALEDYALARMAYSHHLGEVGAVVRLLLWARGIPYRVYDVQAVKLFATGNGNAEKAEVVIACRDRWDLNFLEYGKTTGAGGNVADAFVIAQLLRTEVALRAGTLRLEDLPEAERRVFTRTSKQRPENILSTPFAQRETFV